MTIPNIPAERDTYLSDLVNLLWPAQADTGYHRGALHTMAALPSLRAPRLLVPVRPLSVAAAALRNFKASASGLGRLRNRSMAAGARLGALSVLPKRVIVAQTEDSIDSYLSRILDTQLYAALYIGPQRAVQKPILQLIDPRGHTLAFAKLGTNALTASLIRHESQSVDRIGRSAPRHFRTPEVITHSQWKEAELIVHSAALGDGRHDRLRRILPDATSELARCLGVQRRPWASSPYRSRLHTQLHALPVSEQRSQLLRGLQWFDDYFQNTPLPFGTSHGDWTPWNMAISGGRLTVWDWEHLESDVPVGLDAIHYDVSVQLSTGVSPFESLTQVLCGNGPLTRAVCGPEYPSVLTTLYVFELATRYLRHGEDVIASTGISQLGSWLPQVLTACRERLGSR